MDLRDLVVGRRYLYKYLPESFGEVMIHKDIPGWGYHFYSEDPNKMGICLSAEQVRAHMTPMPIMVLAV